MCIYLMKLMDPKVASGCGPQWIWEIAEVALLGRRGVETGSGLGWGRKRKASVPCHLWGDPVACAVAPESAGGDDLLALPEDGIS